MKKYASALLLVVLMVTMLFVSANLGRVRAVDDSSETTQPLTPTSPVQNLSENLSGGPFADDFSLDSGLWTLLGSAYRDPVNHDLVLTDANCSEGSAVFFKLPFTGVFTANFSYKVWGGTGGDGFTMFFYKQHYPNASDGQPAGFSLIRDGETLGFNSFAKEVPGYGIEFDEFQNGYDPSSHYVALVEDSTRNHLVYFDDPRVGDNVWHNVSVVVGSSDVGVFLDNQFVLRWDGVLDRSYDWFGFSGSTGAATNRHIIGNFSLTASAADLPPAPPGINKPAPEPTLPPPRVPTLISISTDALSSEVGSTVNVEGRLTDANCSSLGADKTIILSYAVGNSESWFPIGSGQTDALGGYSVQWVPSASGTFMLRIEWSGDSTYAGTSNSTTLSFLPCKNQEVFCVESNSTVTGLEFNDSNRTLTFTVSGPNGTIGYTKLVLDKSLISDASGITTLVDGKAVNFTASSTNETWKLEFTYHHSTHQVNINLNSQAEKSPTATHAASPPLLWLALIAAIASAATATVIARRKKKNRSDN